MRIVAVLAAMIVPLAVYLPVYQQREQAIQRADEAIKKLDTRIEQAQAAQRKLPQFREEVQKLNVEIVKLRNILPPEPALDPIRNSVDSAAHDSGIEIERFQPRENIKREYIEVPIETTAVGKLTDLQALFEHLSNKSPIMWVSEVTLIRESGDQWRAKFLTTSFALP